MSKSNYYRTLGVHQNASEKDIRKAYIALALKYHPDKNEDKDAREKFQEIQSAYETLSDRDKRRAYDDALASTRQRKNLYSAESPAEELDPSPFTWPYDMGSGGVSDIPWVFLWDQEHFWDGTSSIFDSLNFFLEGIHGILGRIRDPLFRNIGMIHEMMSNPFTDSLYMPHMRPPGRARSATHSREGMYYRCHRHFPHAHGTSPTHRQKTIPTHRHLSTRHSASATTKGSHKRRAKTAGKD